MATTENTRYHFIGSLFSVVFAALASLLLMTMTPTLVNASGINETDHFREALEAARNNRFDQLDSLEKQLGQQHPLAGYLTFNRLRHRMPETPPEQVNAYLQRYADSPLAASMARLAIYRYAMAGDWAAIRALQTDEPLSTEHQCYWWQAQYKVQPEVAQQATIRLWLSGHSQPDSCDPLFQRARQSGAIDDQTIWERMLLAFRAGNPGLLRYLNSLLNEDYQSDGQTLARLYNQPLGLMSLRQQPDNPRYQDLLSAGFYRLAESDTPAALTLLVNVENYDLQPGEATRSDAERRIAWYSTIRDIPDNRRWLDHWLMRQGDDNLLQQRVRRAIIEQRWEDIPRWIARLPVETQQGARWQYWLGRTWEIQGEKEMATHYFQNAASQRSFWGFLAAEKLGTSPSLNHHYPSLNAQLTGTPESIPALTRIRLLQLIDEHGHARSEWLHLINNSPEEKRQRLAALAHQEGWHDYAIQASIRGNAFDALSWRFPAAFENEFQQAGKDHGLDPLLLMAVARRESSFYPQAVSPAGARGLMQLMPGTARLLRQWHRQPGIQTRQLHDPQLNITLGSTYLATLLERYRGNRLLALAAYNAGSARIDQWLDNDSKAFDVWIESIPFYETRDYVQAVLAYRLILATLNGDNSSELQLLAASETDRPYDIALRPDRAMREVALMLAQRQDP